jgi:hypothetical protein
MKIIKLSFILMVGFLLMTLLSHSIESIKTEKSESAQYKKQIKSQKNPDFQKYRQAIWNRFGRRAAYYTDDEQNNQDQYTFD